MPCYHPNVAYRKIGESGTPNIVKYSSDDYELFNLTHPKELFNSWLVPCGKCIGCRLEYSRQWADRMVLESLTRSPSWFITLTYNDFNLPLSSEGLPTLRRRDFQLFMKRLRSRLNYEYGYDIEFTFYYCGEYGSNYSRPHYHFCVFGLPLTDLKYRGNKNGFPTYQSPLIDECWNNGFCTVNEFSWETGAYVARYMLKKQKGSDSLVYTQNGISPEFCGSSRNPAIGKSYFYDNYKQIYEDGYIIIPHKSGITHSPIPKYFDKLLEKEDPAYFNYIKKKREIDGLDRYLSDFYNPSRTLSLSRQREIDESYKIDNVHQLSRELERFE